MIVSTRYAERHTSRLVLVCYAAAALASIALVAATWQEWLLLPLDRTEVLAFVTGAWSVWLAAKNNVWTWPIGVLNSAFFVVLFWDARLYFDMALNVFYVLSGLWGWWVWTVGGQRRTPKPVARAAGREILLVLAAVAGLTLGFWRAGIFIADAAPFLDALTTSVSIGAQWLLMRRLFENWYFWIAADLVYIPLYAYKGLPLTALLYVMFLLMCVRGLIEWRAILHRQPDALAGALP
jgi:nicotinamide mononucleotide transporter